MRILVAEDDPAIRELLVEVLTYGGHDLRGVSAPQEALSLAQAQAWDLFLVDTLGQADHGFSEQCKGFVQSLAAHAPVILCTAHPWARHLDPHEVGAAAILLKPFDIYALLDLVKTAGKRQATVLMVP